MYPVLKGTIHEAMQHIYLIREFIQLLLSFSHRCFQLHVTQLGTFLSKLTVKLQPLTGAHLSFHWTHTDTGHPSQS